MIFFLKFAFFKTQSKSDFGVVSVQFWIWIRILHEKLYIYIGSDQLLIDFWKSYMLFFSLSFLAFGWYFEVREHQSRTQHEKYPWGLILRFFGQTGGR